MRRHSIVSFDGVVVKAPRLEEPKLSPRLAVTLALEDESDQLPDATMASVIEESAMMNVGYAPPDEQHFAETRRHWQRLLHDWPSRTALWTLRVQRGDVVGVAAAMLPPAAGEQL